MIQLIGLGLMLFLLFRLEQAFYKKIWNRELSVSIQLQEQELFEGDTGCLKEIISNAKRFPLNMLTVKFQTSRYLIFPDFQGSQTTDQFYRNDVFQINGGEKITRSLPFTAGKRGYYEIRNVDLAGTDLFLTSHMYQSVEMRVPLYVYPKPWEGGEFLASVRRLSGEILTRRHLLEDPFEYRGIREYQPGDDTRSINWKASAKTGELKVNQKNYTSLKSVRIFLNTEDTGIIKKEDCVEACFRIAAGLCLAFLAQGMQVSCYGNGLDAQSGKPLVIKASGGKEQQRRILRALACIDTTKPAESFPALFRETLMTERTGVMTCFVSANYYPDYVALLEEYKALGEEFVWYYAWQGFGELKIPESLQAYCKPVSPE